MNPASTRTGDGPSTLGRPPERGAGERAGWRRGWPVGASTRRARRRAVLVIGDNGYRLIRFSGRSLVEVSIWPRDEAGRQAAMARLHTLDEKTFGGCHLSVLVDSIEQTYRREELPAGNALDRRRIVERRLDVAFPATPLRRAIPLRAREPSGTARTAPEKPDGRLPYLFAALPPNDDLEHWCGTLPTLDRPVEGLGLLPLETAARTADLRRLVEHVDRAAVDRATRQHQPQERQPQSKHQYNE